MKCDYFFIVILGFFCGLWFFVCLVVVCFFFKLKVRCPDDWKTMR